MKVVPVEDARLRNLFIRLPWQIYAGDKNWVPPLIATEKKMLDPRRNPFYHHADACHFLALDGERPVGRVSAIVNHLHNELHNEKTGFWGYFECEDRPETAEALFDAASAWLRERGMTRMLGPANPSFNDPTGLLVDGFLFPPFVLMTYNPARYVKLVEDCGFTRTMDLLAYIIVHNELDREKIDRVASIVRKRSNVTLRNVDPSRLREELSIVQEIYNDAWSTNWGFVPMTNEEIRFAAADMKSILLPELVYIAEREGKPVGFSLALPDINDVLKRCNGSLWPFKWLGFLKSKLRKIPKFRLIALGVRKQFQHLGIGTLFYEKYIVDGLERGYRAAELSWILESNDLMRRPIEQLGAKPYKTYRLYERAISPTA